MKFLLSFSCILLVLESCYGAPDNRLLVRSLDALTRSLNYMLEKVSEINLDATFCARRVQEQLQSFLEFQPNVFQSVRHWLEVLRDKAKRVADEGMTFIHKTQPDYASMAGLMVNESKKLAWYPSRDTSLEYTDVPIPCPSYYYDTITENYCYYQLSGSVGDVCNVSPDCYRFNSQWNQRDYALTHQVLFWEAMEGHKCVDTISERRRLRHCSNIMRDANRTAAADFPNTHIDLFMEQVGLCGFWGFRDFNKPEWLEKILEWQLPSGCYRHIGYHYCFDELPKEPHKRVKRSEIRLKDGCLSHKTAVAMLALVVNIRFEAEKDYLQSNGSTNEINALLHGTQMSF